MSDKRRGLGRGLGALIPPAPATPGMTRPSDVFFAERATPGSARFTGNMDAGAESPPHDPVGLDTAATGDATEVGGAGTSGARLRAVPGARFADLPVDQIRRNPKQPRQVFDEDELAELVQSIQEIGVLQPVVVREVGASEEVRTSEGTRTSEGVRTSEESVARYELIMGERRLRACVSAGLERIPAIIRSTSDEHMLRDALLENLHRSQLNPLEEAAAYQQLLEDFHCTHDELATRIGRSRPQISNTIRLLKLPPLVARRVAAGVLSAGHARALLALPDGASMERVAQRIVAEGLSVRSTEEIVALGNEVQPRRRSTAREPTVHPQLDDLAESLSNRLDTRVVISLGKRKGRLTVEFAGVEDLQRIMDTLGMQGN